MKYFLDTCIFVRATLEYEEDYDKAKSMVIKSSDVWATSTIVYEELSDIKKRRMDIYKKIIGSGWGNRPIEKELLWKKYFKSALESSLRRSGNDEIHLRSLFEYCLKQAKLDKVKTLNEKDFNSFKEAMFPVIQEIKVKTGKIVSRFADARYYHKHVVQKYYLDPICRKLKKEFYNLPGGKNHKEDLKIVMDGIIYSEDIMDEIRILTTDMYLYNIKEKIKQSAKRIRSEANIDIINLRDLK